MKLHRSMRDSLRKRKTNKIARAAAQAQFPYEVEALFRDIAAAFDLEIELLDDPVELAMRLPVQDGLQFDIYLCMQNTDELWFCVDDFFTYSSFPYPVVQDEFRLNLSDFLSGRSRLRNARYSVVLERPDGASWERVSSYSGGGSRGLSQQQILRNDPAFRLGRGDRAT